MKTIRSLLTAWLIVVVVGIAIPLRAEGARQGPAKAPAADKAAPVADKAAPAAPGENAEQPKIPGVVIPREKGGFLGLVIENGNFKLAFYDANRKPVSVDVARATARWTGHRSIFDERTVLNPAPDGLILTSSKFVRPPYVFKLYLTLIPAGENPAVENHIVDVHL